MELLASAQTTALRQMCQRTAWRRTKARVRTVESGCSTGEGRRVPADGDRERSVKIVIVRWACRLEGREVRIAAPALKLRLRRDPASLVSLKPTKVPLVARLQDTRLASREPRVLALHPPGHPALDNLSADASSVTRTGE
ncbi:hypothetical protein ONZ51_g6949 [Trametes cubensis]|uniref:Uncharacterized protein n=1 Tax=Trametes cubensis TaxID=1111947 RepID=A0AAD7XC94_9APHY|nr:hypothetical protein ONZ51_g6949 [Trametes cubensis]